MPESFIPVWMSIGEAEEFRRFLQEEARSTDGEFPDREFELLDGALETERPRSYDQMKAEQGSGESKADGERREAAVLLDAATHFQRVAVAHELRPDGDSSKAPVYRGVAERLRSFVPDRLRDTEGERG